MSADTTEVFQGVTSLCKLAGWYSLIADVAILEDRKNGSQKEKC